MVLSALMTSLEFRPNCIFGEHNGLDVTIKYIREPQHETVTFKIDLAIASAQTDKTLFRGKVASLGPSSHSS